DRVVGTQRVEMCARRGALPGEEERRADLHARGAHLERPPHVGAVHDPAGGDHRDVHVDRGEQLLERHEPVLERTEERPAMAARDGGCTYAIGAWTTGWRAPKKVKPRRACSRAHGR